MLTTPKYYIMLLDSVDISIVHKIFQEISQAELPKVVDYIKPFIQNGIAIVLCGDLGAGKTTFARYLIESITGMCNVVSPTFNLVQVYEGKGKKVWHYDLYRLKYPEELEELAIEEALSNVIIMEWHQIAKAYLPDKVICITIDFTTNYGSRNFAVDIKND